MILLLTALACGSDKPHTVDSDAEVTYNADVAPILRERCEGCHSEGQSGPFRLNTYEDVSVIGASVAESVESRRMPPWLADDDCNTYVGSRAMPQAEIDLIRAWVDEGMPEGDPADALEPYTLPEGALDGVTHSVALQTPYAPDFAGQNDDYRCFMADPQLTEDGFLTGFEVLPGDPEIVHHVVLFAPAGEAAVERALELDEADPGPGYTCFGDFQVSGELLAVWVPGVQKQEYPQGTGIAMSAGNPLLIQMHYNNSGNEDATDATALRLRVEDHVDEPLYPFFWVNGSLRIPPGLEAHEQVSTDAVSDQAPGTDGQLMLHTIGPHMHSIGSQLTSTLVRPDGSETCLLDVPRWDFNWQMAYDFAEPVPLSQGDEIRLSCTFDSSERRQFTSWGDGTGDEMCLTTMFVTIEE